MKKLGDIFLLIIFIGAFFKGMYFYHELFITTTLLLIVLFLIIFKNKKVIIPKDNNLYLILGLVMLYVLTTSIAIDSGMAFFGGLKYLSYFIFFIIYCQLYSDEFREKAVDMIMYSSIVGATLGIVAFILKDIIYLGMVYNNRLSGFIQYANTYGLYCLIGIIFLIRKQIGSRTQVILLTILITATTLTFSRTTYIIGIFVVIITSVFSSNRKNIIISTIISLPLSISIIKLCNIANTANRIANTSLKASELQTRFLYYIDGLKIIKDFPFGLGHLGYYYIQRYYQTGSLYYVKYIHNSLIQIVLDIGIIGGTVVIIYFVYNIITNTNWYYRLALLVIMGHSLLDFNIEFPIIIITIIIINGVNNKKIKYINKIKSPVIIMSLVSVIYIFFSIVTALNHYGYYNKSLKLYPYYTDSAISLIKDNKLNSEELFKLSSKISNYNKYSVEAFAYNRDYYYNNDYKEKTLYYAKETINLNPLNIYHVEKYGEILLEYSKHYDKKQNYNQAKKLLNIIASLPEYINNLEETRTTSLKVKHKPSLKMTNKLENLYKEAQKRLEKY